MGVCRESGLSEGTVFKRGGTCPLCVLSVTTSVGGTGFLWLSQHPFLLWGMPPLLESPLSSLQPEASLQLAVSTLDPGSPLPALLKESLL